MLEYFEQTIFKEHFARCAVFFLASRQLTTTYVISTFSAIDVSRLFVFTRKIRISSFCTPLGSHLHSRKQEIERGDLGASSERTVLTDDFIMSGFTQVYVER